MTTFVFTPNTGDGVMLVTATNNDSGQVMKYSINIMPQIDLEGAANYNMLGISDLNIIAEGQTDSPENNPRIIVTWGYNEILKITNDEFVAPIYNPDINITFTNLVTLFKQAVINDKPTVGNYHNEGLGILPLALPASKLHSLNGINPNVTRQYLKIYDSVASPTLGVDTPIYTTVIEANNERNLRFSEPLEATTQKFWFYVDDSPYLAVGALPANLLVINAQFEV